MAHPASGHDAWSYEVELTDTASRAYWTGTPGADSNVHYSSTAAQSAGLPALLVSAPHLLSICDLAMADIFGATWALTGRLDLKFIGMALTGSRVVVRSRLSERHPEETGAATMVLDVRLDTGDPQSRPLCIGTARARLDEDATHLNGNDRR